MNLYEEISRNPHNVTPRNLIRLIVSYGFEYRRTRGDHEIYKRAGYRPFPVPIRQNPLSAHIVMNALRVIREIQELDQ